MSCTKNVSYISKKVLVNGRKSAIYLEDYYTLGILPRGGKTNEVLTKCRNADYYTDWVDPNTLVTGGGKPYVFWNGLSEPSALDVRLGGDLIQDTVIDGVNTYDFSIGDVSTLALYSDTQTLVVSPDINIGSGSGSSVSLLGGDITIQTSNTGLAPNFAPLLKLNTSSEVEYGQVAFPSSTGTAGQVLTLFTSNNAIWQDLQSDNGLTTVSGEIHLGGNLIKNTTVDGAGLYNLEFANFVTGLFSGSGDITIDTPLNIDIIALTTLLLESGAMQIRPSNHNAYPANAVLQSTNPATGESVFTPYGLPSAVATRDKQKLSYDTGTNTATWASEEHSAVETLTDEWYDLTGKPIYRRIVQLPVWTTSGDETGDVVFDAGVDTIDELVGSGITINAKLTAGPNTGALTSLHIGDGASWSGSAALFYDSTDTLLSWENLYDSAQIATDQPQVTFTIYYTKN